MTSLELFAGCGGMALGISKAGFKHQLIIENDEHACSTLKLNKAKGVAHVAGWPLFEKDIREADYSRIPKIDLVSGGPPCQPFSIGGSHKGPKDKRNMWPEVIRCVRQVRPQGFIFENVKGLLRPAFGRYLESIRLQLAWPDLVRLNNETEAKYLKRLSEYEKKGHDPAYKVLIHEINTADFGAPQKRHRALIMGVSNELSSKFIFPARTHSHEALLWSQYKTGEYWEKFQVSRRRRRRILDNESKILERTKEHGEPVELPWITVRNSISDLPDPMNFVGSLPNHEFHPGARIYSGHSGSHMDEPAKALKAGSHGVPGGENVINLDGGDVRYFTIREMARLQGLPDEYFIDGTWVNSTRQLGNAVPVQVGAFFGREFSRIFGGVNPCRESSKSINQLD